MDTTETIIVRLARNCALMVQNAGHKGKKRDAAVADFWAGAAIALREVGHEDAEWVERVTMLLIFTRGYSEVELLVREADAKSVEVA